MGKESRVKGDGSRGRWGAGWLPRESEIQETNGINKLWLLMTASESLGRIVSFTPEEQDKKSEAHPDPPL